jgi:hypothetical protein
MQQLEMILLIFQRVQEVGMARGMYQPLHLWVLNR